ncbi:DUF2167 domain-containing protein [Marinobacter arenosus]|uniref:DUF2167 domain-containing protein n=1 Tax=Marinobacter arenosus TaxID=2856822 RepID=UPI001C4B7568|nr:DUF2167 domain-containing protein [Marinobacter arenosus]MBW0148031.1 DUF2167 domain-containing protein [Marinobacter arenosus]
MKIVALMTSVLLLSYSPLSLANETADAQTPTEAEITAQEQEYRQWAQEFVDSLNYQQGEISLPNGVATLNVPESFYYLSPEDTQRVLVEAWGNPPGGQTLGMLFPSDVTPLDDASWGVTIEYEEDGYVSDENASEIDYADLLEQMQEDTREVNPERVEAGYQPIELVGWAATPHYNEASHKLYWAQELQFGDDPYHTLNYNIRVLGRQGVLVLNFIAGMHQLPEIEANLDTVLDMAQFDDGHRYSDFDPEVDTVAAYGLGALVAGKAAAKAGFFAAALLFLKKFGVIILAGLAAIGGKLWKSRKSDT